MKTNFLRMLSVPKNSAKCAWSSIVGRRFAILCAVASFQAIACLAHQAKEAPPQCSSRTNWIQLRWEAKAVLTSRRMPGSRDWERIVANCSLVLIAQLSETTKRSKKSMVATTAMSCLNTPWSTTRLLSQARPCKLWAHWVANLQAQPWPMPLRWCSRSALLRALPSSGTTLAWSKASLRAEAAKLTSARRAELFHNMTTWMTHTITSQERCSQDVYSDYSALWDTNMGRLTRIQIYRWGLGASPSLQIDARRKRCRKH